MDIQETRAPARSARFVAARLPPEKSGVALSESEPDWPSLPPRSEPEGFSAITGPRKAS